MGLIKLEKKPLPQIPVDIAEHLETAGMVTLTEFEDKNNILEDAKLQSESGYSRFPDGSYLVFLRRIMINDRMAKGMAEHCAVEYRNLAEILPSLYAENK